MLFRSESAASRLIDIGKVKWQDAVKNIVMGLFRVFFQRPGKDLIAGPLATGVCAQDMHVGCCYLTFGGKNMSIIADCPDGLSQFTDGALSPPQGNIGPLNYDCDLRFHLAGIIARLSCERNSPAVLRVVSGHTFCLTVDSPGEVLVASVQFFPAKIRPKKSQPVRF